mmetsp:Transcript_32930/g.75832  ORF Transcript_32930/g.75832 Transcript_32930/m.75832 type:complete len:313 (+) Transcript_32930:282-1220(+)
MHGSSRWWVPSCFGRNWRMPSRRWTSDWNSFVGRRPRSKNLLKRRKRWQMKRPRRSRNCRDSCKKRQSKQQEPWRRKPKRVHNVCFFSSSNKYCITRILRHHCSPPHRPPLHLRRRTNQCPLSLHPLVPEHLFVLLLYPLLLLSSLASSYLFSMAPPFWFRRPSWSMQRDVSRIPVASPCSIPVRVVPTCLVRWWVSVLPVPSRPWEIARVWLGSLRKMPHDVHTNPCIPLHMFSIGHSWSPCKTCAIAGRFGWKIRQNRPNIDTDPPHDSRGDKLRQCMLRVEVRSEEEPPWEDVESRATEDCWRHCCPFV